MTNEERDIIGQFIARVGGAPRPASFAAGSVPAVQPALPPIDRDADAFIGQAFAQIPEARYRVVQLAFVQEHALAEAQNRIQRLEWELQQARQQAQQAQAQPASGGGFFSGLFGGGARPQAAPPPGPPPQGAPPQGDPRWGGQGAGYPGGQPQQAYYPQPAPPQPQYPPNYQQGMFQQRGGSGFLGSALTTAAGVAGGMVAGEALMNLFSPHQGMGGSGFGGAPGDSPWAAPGQESVNTGSWDQGGGASEPSGNQDYVDNGTWDQPGGAADSSWTDNGGGGGDSSWDSGGGDSGGGGSDDTF